MSERAETHVGSGQVMTVRGPVPAADLGITLMHEHLLNDCRCWWNQPKEARRAPLACAPVNAGILGELRMDPFVNLDNCRLDDERLAIAELLPAVELGCRTLVDPTCRGIGRDARALVRIAEGSGLNIVMGGGYYLQASHPPELARDGRRGDRGGDPARRARGGRRQRRAHRPDRRDRRLRRVHRGRGKVAARRRPRGAAQRVAADGAPARLVPPRASRARHRGGGGRRPRAYRAVPHEPVLRRRRVSDVAGAARGVHRIRHDRHGLLLCRSGRAVPVGRGQRARDRGADRGGIRAAPAAVAGRVPQDDADAPWRVRLRLPAAAFRAAAGAPRGRGGGDHDDAGRTTRGACSGTEAAHDFGCGRARPRDPRHLRTHAGGDRRRPLPAAARRARL